MDQRRRFGEVTQGHNGGPPLDDERIEERRGRAISLWEPHPDSVPVDPRVWWWQGMSKALAAIPLTTNPIVEAAARRLATAYLQHGAVPDDPVACKVFTGLDARTMKKHWSAIKHIMVTYFAELPEGRREVVKKMISKVEAGRAGGRAAHTHAAHKLHMSDTYAAHVQAGLAKDRHFLEAEPEIDIDVDVETKEAASRRDYRLASQPTASCIADLSERYGQSEARIMRVWAKIESKVTDIKNPNALLRKWCATEDW